MIVIMCPDCGSTHITKYAGRMYHLGHDWFTCEKCNKNFPLKNVSYREENNIYND